MRTRAASPSQRWTADVLVAVVLVAGLYGLMHLSALAPDTYAPRQIDLHLVHLPYYAIRSLLRMLGAYLLSLLFTLAYGYPAAYNQRASRILMPVLDILQSIPVLSFMPSVVLALVALFPQGNLGPELASIILIFTGQVWNMTFSFVHSLQTIPADLKEVSGMLQMNWWYRFRRLELPSAATGLVWNSMMSWAGGWFFLMASEMFTMGSKQFTLPGIGSYLQTAANQGDIRAVLWGLGTLVLMITLLDQLVWRPVVAWADKFKLELVNAVEAPHSAVLTVLRRSNLMEWLGLHLFGPLGEWIDGRLGEAEPVTFEQRPTTAGRVLSWLFRIAAVVAVAFGLWQALQLMGTLSFSVVGDLAKATVASLLRVLIALVIGLAWTIPAGVAIGSNPRLSTVLQPLTQILASVPATALFPVILLALLRLPAGIDIAAVVLLLMGTQWYLLFNIIAGASAIPADLKEAATSLELTGWLKWKTLILPAIFPHVVTGLVTASGGAWNATIVSEYVHFQGEVHQTIGLGSLIAASSATEEFGLLLAATLTLAVIVVSINRLVWRRLYKLAETKYSL